MSKRPAATTAKKRPPAKRPAAPPPPPPAPEPPTAPPTLKAAAVVQALEAVGMLVATGFSADATITGKSYQTASGIALTLIAFGAALGFAAIARGLSQVRPWSRTPSAITQVFAIALGIYIFDGPRPEWGIPTLLLAAAGIVLLMVPASFNALNRER